MKTTLRILKALRVIVFYKDVSNDYEYTFNLKNPLGYLLLLVAAIIAAVIAGCREGWQTLYLPLKDAVGPKNRPKRPVS